MRRPQYYQPKSLEIGFLFLVIFLRPLRSSGSRIFLNQTLKLFWYITILVYSPILFQLKCSSQSPFISFLYSMVFTRAAGNKIACYMPQKFIFPKAAGAYQLCYLQTTLYINFKQMLTTVCLYTKSIKSHLD